MANGSEGPAPLDDLVFRFLEDCEDSGRPPSEVLEGLCRENPGAAPRLRAAVETLSGTGLGLPGQTTTGQGQEDARVVGRYRMLERLGAGGMGVVHRAEPLGGGPEVALKLLHPRVQNEPEARDRFEREAKAIERLDHPAIVRILDYGEVEEGGVSTPYLAMAFHRGVSLDAFISSMGLEHEASADGAELGAHLHAEVAPSIDPLERSSRFRGPWWQVVARIGADLASALAHAHERGVVHRDVKPSNVLAAPDGRVLLLDFGLAYTRDSGRLTRSGAQLGSLPYMAPEQVAGRATDASVDVYALGLVLYELLTLRPAFDATSRDALAVSIERGKSLRPSRVVDWIPASVAASVDAVIERATQCDPRHRYPTARAFADDLDALVAGRAVSTEPIGTATRALRAARRHPWHVAFASVVAAFLVVGVIVLTFYESQIAADARDDIAAEIAAIEGRLDSLRSGFVGLSVGPLGSDPRFAPSALQGMVEERDQMRRACERLRELAADGEDVEDLARRADTLLADVLIGIANARASLGEERDAIAAYREHGEHLDRMMREWTGPDGEPPVRTLSERGRSLGMLARAIHLAGPVETGLAEAQRAVELIREARARGEESSRSTGQLIAAMLIRSEAEVRAGDPAAAKASLDLAERISEEAFGPEPTTLYHRAQRGEIELRRARYGFVDGGRDAVIATLRRSVDWIDGSRSGVDEDASIATIRLDAGRWLALELRRARRFEEAKECTDELLRLTDRLAASRGADASPDDPFVSALGAVEMVAALLRADLGGDVERSDAIATFWEAHERARTDHLERPHDVEASVAYLHRAGVYANQAVFQPDAESWQVARAIEAVRAALEATAELDESVPQVYGTRRHCRYAHGLALVRAGRESSAYEVARELEDRAAEQDPTDAISLRMAADLCNELYLTSQDGPGGESLRVRTLDLLEAAVDAGFRDVTELKATEALEPLRDDPRFVAIIERLEGDGE